MATPDYTPSNKQCTKCGELKGSDQFEETRRQCKKCVAERHKKYWQENKVKNREKQNRWYKKAREAGMIPKGNHRKRAIKYGVPYERVSPEKVFDRDGWKCQICGKSTPKRNRGTRYTNAPELDHRIPMSLGGSHLYENCQCSCRACNIEKSNSNDAGQYPLLCI